MSPSPTATRAISPVWRAGVLSIAQGINDDAVLAVEGADRIEVTPVADVEGPHANGMVSAKEVSLEGGTCAVRIASAATDGAATCFGFGVDSSNWYRFCIEGRTIYFQSCVNGTRSASSIAYDAAACRYLRFRHDANRKILFWEISSDGETWRVADAAIPKISLSSVRFELCAGTNAAVPTPGRAVFDGFELLTR